jgi:hypothetical protein
MIKNFYEGCGMDDVVYFAFLQSKAQKQLSPELLKEFFIQSVKAGDTLFARKLLESPDFQCALTQSLYNDSELILYQGRLLSQERNFDGFFEFYDEKKNPLLKSAELPEGLLSWNWRMAVNKAISNDFAESRRYFEMHKSEAIISAHEMAHYYQCQGSTLILNPYGRDKGISFLYKALSEYFTVFQRDENYYNIVDNIRCIVVNLLIQGVFEYIDGYYGLAYKKFAFCRTWFQQANIPKSASGISELSTLIEMYDPHITEFVFGRELWMPKDEDTIRGICEGREIANVCTSGSKKFDIGYIRESCILLNKPLDNTKYIFLEDVIMQAKKVFVVEGRNAKINQAMFDFLSSLGLEPIEWEQARASTGGATPFIGEILDCAFKMAQAIVVLLTPDEETTLCEALRCEKGDDALRFQPRPNVIFEAGAAMAINPERTILVSFGNAYTWTDISGRHLLKMDNTSEKRTTLCGRLRTAGCNFSTEGKAHWLSSGDFNV